MARDRVSPAQEKVLAFRSGNACAYPGCGTALVLSAKHNEDQDKAVGKAAHIAAASEGGPRYDSSMSKDQRGSSSNLMFLCGPHHDAVDSQLNYHTTEFLLGAKAAHEKRVSRAIRYSMGEVRFDHLEMVCKGLVINGPPLEDDDIELPLEIDEKIDLNAIGSDGRGLILLGISQVEEVRRFIASMTGFSSDFGSRLTARFKQFYYQGAAEGLASDELYIYVYSVALEYAGPIDSLEVQASVLSVVAYLFSLCEIFEHEPTAA